MNRIRALKAWDSRGVPVKQMWKSAVLGVVLCLVCLGCGSGFLIQLVVPNISQVSPQTITAGTQGFTLQVKGTNFDSQSVVLWNNGAMPTHMVDAGTLTATVGSNVIATPTVAQLQVKNGTGQESTPVQMNVLAASQSLIPPIAITSGLLPAGRNGVAYVAALLAIGGTPGYAWSLNSGTLPSGLSLSPAGVISGTPNAAGTSNFIVTVTDNGSPVQTQTLSASITIAPAQLAITTGALPSGQNGHAYSTVLSAAGGTPGYVWAVASGSLPAGLSLSTGGVISGTPSSAGTSSFTVTLTDSGSPAQTQTVAASITVAPSQLAITSGAPPAGQVGKGYSDALSASGGTSGYAWSVASGSLPAGLSLSATGVISGTPTSAGAASFSIAVTDSGSPAQSQTVSASITIAPSQLAITSGALPAGQAGKSYTATLAADGGTPGYMWSVASGSLPAGLSLSAAGIISGTPTSAGPSSFSIAVTDSGSPAQVQTASASITIAPSQLAITSGTPPAGQLGKAYSVALLASGGTPGYTWSVSSGSLPAGLSLSAAGVISGTPTSAGASSFSIAVTDSGSPAQVQTASASITVVGPSLAITSSSPGAGQMGQAYSGTLSAGGGTPGYTWSVASGSLPTGLTLSSAGVISGTPTSAGTSTFGIAVTDSGTPAQTQTASASITIAPSQLAITSAAPVSGQVGKTYSDTLSASGGTSGYTWSVSSGSLPAGLTLSAAGVISGTPTGSGTANFTIAVVDSGSPVQTQTALDSITISGSSLTITPTSLGAGQVGTAYSSTLSASGGTPGYTWSVKSGNLPLGLTLSEAGVISGTPTASGTANFVVMVADNGSLVQTQTASESITVSGSPLTITSVSLGAGQVGTAYSSTLSASGGTPGYTWTVKSGNLPAGLTLSAAGVISGTPTTSGAANFVVTVADNGSPVQTKTASESITVSGSSLTITSTSLGAGQVGSSYSTTLVASGGTPSYTWSVKSGSLPLGLTLSAAGVISGTPTASGTANFVVTVADSGSPVQTQTANLSLKVSPSQLTIVSTSLGAGQNGTAYSSTLSATGGTPGYTWSINSGNLPAGLNLSAAGVISGTPTGSGTASFTVAVTDNGSPAQVGTASMSIAIAAALTPLSITPPVIAAGTVGSGYTLALSASGGTPAYTWSIKSGNLPAGVTLAATTGVISGTPTTVGNYSATIGVSDNGSPQQSQSVSVSITVNAAAPPPPGTTWYVRPDGGTRYSASATSGQCDGKGDKAYPGTGTNQHCAFSDVRSLWDDGAYSYGTTGDGHWGWIIAGGDTVIIRGSLADGVTYRVGWNSNSYCDSTQCYGITGDPFDSGVPTPPSGTAGQHTRILGGNYASCHSAGAKTQLHGGFGVNVVLNMAGVSYVDVACLDITDFSSCGKASQTSSCSNPDGTLADFARVGINWSNTSTHDTVTDVHIHGMADAGMKGPTGDGVSMDYIDVLGNASSGWNADNSDGTTGTGKLTVTHYNISWNGCAEEYPIVHAVPYGDCTDQDSGGYGDGFGTATVMSSPGWAATFDQGVVAYNTQDGLDALHLIGSGSSMTVTRTLAYGNMGQQIKVGGESGTSINNVIVGNCNAMRQPIPGTPSGYNSKLSLFCRAGDGAVLLTAGVNSTLTFDYNTIYSANAVAVEIECDGSAGACDASSKVDYRNNIFVGFPDSVANGNPNIAANDIQNPTPIYNGTGIDFFANTGSYFSNNVTFQPRSNWSCPATHETHASCGDPGLVDETWHLYGYGNMTPASPSSSVVGAGTMIPAITLDYTGTTRGNPPTIGAYQ